jgi:transposase
MLETGEIKGFPMVGDYASYCRCVGSQKLSNGKKKDELISREKKKNFFLICRLMGSLHRHCH